MRTWMIAVAALAAIILVAVLVNLFTGGFPVEAAPAVRGAVQEYVDERGKTRLPQTYNITMPLEGRISAIDLIEGTPVKKRPGCGPRYSVRFGSFGRKRHRRRRSIESVDSRKTTTPAWKTRG